MEHRFTLEKPDGKLVLDSKNRNRVKKCPFCGKSNYDGKFIPFVGYTRYGKCYSCGVERQPANNCPECKQPSFTYYIDKQTGLRLDDSCGYCSNCKHNYPPREYIRDNGGWEKFIEHDYLGVISVDKYNQMVDGEPPFPPTRPEPDEPPPPSFISRELFSGSLRSYNENRFVRWLYSIFPREMVSRMVNDYYIGTSRHWPGSTVFWQIDASGNIRAGKIMLYDETTGKRDKQHHPDWVHNVARLDGFNMEQSLFGMHLVKHHPGKTIGIVESEKTAIICSGYLPGLVWLSCGGLGGLSLRKLLPLAGKSIVLFPDANGFIEWVEKSKQFSAKMPGTSIVVSELLERHCSDDDKRAGFDLADYLIEFPVEQFIPEHGNDTEVEPEPGEIYSHIGQIVKYYREKYGEIPPNCIINAGNFKSNRNMI